MDLKEEAPLQVEAVAALDLSPAATKVDADTSVNLKGPRSCVNNQLKLFQRCFIPFIVALIISWNPVAAINVPASYLGVPVIGMESDLESYSHLSFHGRRIVKMYSPFTMSRVGLRVLERQTLPARPPAWLANKIVDEDYEVVFLIRSDNLYIGGFINPGEDNTDIGVLHSFTECVHMFPNAIDLGIGGSYKDLNGGRENLTGLNLSRDTMKEALEILHKYRHGRSDFFTMRTSLTRKALVLCEAQRFTEIHECLLKGWKSECFIRRPKVLLVSWAPLSCGVLEGWKPSLKSVEKYGERSRAYRRTLDKLETTREKAPSLLRFLLVGKECQDSIKGWGSPP